MIDPGDASVQVPTQAEREAAYPRILKLKGAYAHTDIVNIFDAERYAAQGRRSETESSATREHPMQLVKL